MKKTLRDEIAMTMDISLVPTQKNEVTIKYVAEKLGLEEPDINDPISMLNFGLKYHSIIRYMYADEMLNLKI